MSDANNFPFPALPPPPPKTPAQPLATPAAYCTRSTAQLYFDSRLNTQVWDSASVTDQQKALSQATSLIEQLNFAGEVTTQDQPFQFPRGGDTQIPEVVIFACCEVALKLLDDVDVDKEAKAASFMDQHFTTVRTRRDTDFVHEWILAGIPSMVAWNYLRPLLRDVLAVDIKRAN